MGCASCAWTSRGAPRSQAAPTRMRRCCAPAASNCCARIALDRSRIHALQAAVGATAAAAPDRAAGCRRSGGGASACAVPIVRRAHAGAAAAGTRRRRFGAGVRSSYDQPFRTRSQPTARARLPSTMFQGISHASLYARYARAQSWLSEFMNNPPEKVVRQVAAAACFTSTPLRTLPANEANLAWLLERHRERCIENSMRAVEGKSLLLLFRCLLAFARTDAVAQRGASRLPTGSEHRRGRARETRAARRASRSSESQKAFSNASDELRAAAREYMHEKNELLRAGVFRRRPCGAAAPARSRARRHEQGRPATALAACRSAVRAPTPTRRRLLGR